MSRPQSGAGHHLAATDLTHGNPTASSPLSQSMSAAVIDHTASDASSTRLEDGLVGGDRATSTATTAVPATAPSRSNTLKKRGSVRRTASLKRSNSRKSLRAGSLAGYGGVEQSSEYNSFSTTPVPTSGSPTEILANRFQAWRQLLKSLISYFREIQASYEMRAKAGHKVQSAIATITNPSVFLGEHGLSDAARILDDYHKRSIAEANKSREIEEDVIGALTGLRSDLGQKIKEIKSLSGDFKNSVDKEKDATRKEVEKLQEAIQLSERDDGSAIGKNDPFVVKLGVDRAIEKQIDEENYLHRAYLNLESSGRELESIVVGEIQKAYNALAGILKREGDDAYNALDALRAGPIALPKDAEWLAFVGQDPHFIDPNVPLRRIEDIEYPGKHHPSAVEVRAGMLERKSKYLKSYTPGWYVLSPTHLHEFKSADKIYSQPPVMSLYLPDQKLGSHSQPGSSSHKFMVKGRQSGNMHKGHNWVFRAETYDTMLAWFEDMNTLAETSGEQRNAFVRKHARSYSSNSRRASMSSDGMEEDEADAVPYSADAASLPSTNAESRNLRPPPGGRFPSDLQVPRSRAESQGQSSNASSEPDVAVTGGAAGWPDSRQQAYAQYDGDPYRLEGVTAGTATATGEWPDSDRRVSYFGSGAIPHDDPFYDSSRPGSRETNPSFLEQEPTAAVQQTYHTHPSAEHQVAHQDFSSPIIAAGVLGTTAHTNNTGVASPGAPEVPEKSNLRESPPEGNSTEEIAAPIPVVLPVVPITTHNEVESTYDGENESGLGDLPTGTSPSMTRNRTTMSISQLPVPGKFPTG